MSKQTLRPASVNPDAHALGVRPALKRIPHPLPLTGADDLTGLTRRNPQLLPAASCGQEHFLCPSGAREDVGREVQTRTGRAVFLERLGLCLFVLAAYAVAFGWWDVFVVLLARATR